jgi:uncharacterized protein (TIGR02996 family)
MTDDSFCRAIAEAPEDTAARLVYADWLEEQGDPRAEFVRADVRLAAMPAEDPARPALLEQLQDLRTGLDPDWLARLDRTPIENCVLPPTPRRRKARPSAPSLEFAYMCPLRWELLLEGTEAKVRHCDFCHMNVYHCASMAEAREHAWQGHCVAVDSRLTRTPGDLEPPMLMTMGLLAMEEPSGEDEEDQMV